MKQKAAFFLNDTSGFRGEPISGIDAVYGQGRRQQIEELTDMYPEIIGTKNFDEHIDWLREIEVIFATWGMPRLPEEQIAQMSKLRAIFYGAGATGHFREPYLRRDVMICSATSANAVPVAEFCLAQILMCAKGMLNNMRDCRTYEGMTQRPFVGRGVYGAKVSLIGNGHISKYLQNLLQPFHLDVRVIGSRELSANPVILEEVFADSYVVSNHLPDRDDNIGILNGKLFSLMPPNASFINTGRGRQVNEEELAEVFAQRQDLTAHLDVQWPEPPPATSSLFGLPNVHMTSHIAGAFNDELVRLADCMIDEYRRWTAGEDLRCRVTEFML